MREFLQHCPGKYRVLDCWPRYLQSSQHHRTHQSSQLCQSVICRLLPGVPYLRPHGPDWPTRSPRPLSWTAGTSRSTRISGPHYCHWQPWSYWTSWCVLYTFIFQRGYISSEKPPQHGRGKRYKTSGYSLARKWQAFIFM